MSAHGHLVLAGTFLLIALHMARRHGRSAVHYGIDLAGVLEAHHEEPETLRHGLGFALRRALPRLVTEFGFALLIAVLVFPPFIWLFRFWHGVEHEFTFHPPREPYDFVLGHLVAVALPEEALFRGYFQTRLSELFPERVRLLGAELSPRALACQAALFALLHFFVGFSPARLAVFFPGLLFGWIRARRGGIGAAIWFHAMCNLLAEILARGYL
jgi:membrane protease YdiL (CAAX protease family)